MASLTLFFLVCCFVVSSLDSFFVWLSIGVTLYFAFLSIYYWVQSVQRPVAVKHKPTAQELETRAYIAKHLPMVISLLLGGLLLALIILLYLN